MSEEKARDDVIDVEPQIIHDAKPETPPKARRSLRRLFGMGIVLGLACALLGGWFYRDVLASYLPTDQVQTLTTRVDALENANKDATKRIDAIIALTDELKAKLGAAQAQADKSLKTATDNTTLAQGTASAVADLKQALDEEKTSLESLRANLSSGSNGAPDPAMAARLDMLEKQLAALKSAPAPAPAGPDLGALRQAVDGLKAKVAAGAAFPAEIAMVQKLLPAAEGLDVLNAAAAQGSPSAAQLSEALSGIVQNLPRPAAPAAASDGWMDAIGGWFSNLVSIKPIGGDDAATLAAKAAAFAAAGDVQQATDVLNTTNVALPAALQAWRDTALQRLKVEKALGQVSAAAAREIAAKG